MKLDRTLQLEILHTLRDAYPERIDINDLPNPDHPDLRANLWYLAEHELIEVIDIANMEDAAAIYGPKITAVGLDFIEDDGGVSAILRTVTVKLDPDDLRSLIAARVESSDLPAEDKSSLAHAIRSLPVATLQSLTTRLVNEAVAQWPDALQLFQRYLSPG